MGKEGAGHRAWETRYLNDAHRVRDLYRGSFSSERKNTARQRAIRALIAAGGTVCLDLWGGGMSADALVAAGLQVISVDDGQHGKRNLDISTERTRRALEVAAREGGYEAAFGPISKFASRADVAILDYCGGLSKPNRQGIRACRHMKAVVVTLTTDHDLTSAAVIGSAEEPLGLTQDERRVIFEALLRRTFGSHRCRRLCSYKRDTGHPVWVYLLTRDRIDMPRLTNTERRRLDPELREAENARHRAWGKAKKYWASLPVEVRRERVAKANAYKRARMESDPEYAEHIRQLGRDAARRRTALARADDPTFRPSGPRGPRRRAEARQD